MSEPKNSKLNLIIDFNYFLHRTLAVYHSSDTDNGLPKLTTEEDMGFYARKVVIDLCAAIRKFHSVNLNTIILTIDSRSWRKNIHIEENDGYKSNRVKAKTVEWENLYKVADDLAEIFTQNGMFISRIKEAEGDDLMYLYSNRFLANNEDTIILTGDKDMFQTIGHNNENFVSIFAANSKYSKIVLDASSIEKMNDVTENIFEMAHQAGAMNNIKNLQKIAETNKYEILEIDKIHHVFDKVFTGDGGDGVPGIYTWVTETKRGEQENNLTSKRINKIWEFMNTKYSGKDLIYKLPDEIDFIYNEISRIAKHELAVQKEVLREKIKRNITLMYLDDDVIPQSIQEKFEEQFKVVGKSQYIFFKFDVSNFTIENIISGTKYDKKDDKNGMIDGYFRKAGASKMDSFNLDDFFTDDMVKLN